MDRGTRPYSSLTGGQAVGWAQEGLTLEAEALLPWGVL